MLPNGFHDLCRGIGRFLHCLISALCCFLRVLALAAFGGCVFPANGAFLLPAGIRVAGKLRILFKFLCFQRLDIRFVQLPLRFFSLPIGFHLMRVIRMFTHLQGRVSRFVGFQHSVNGDVIVLIGLRDLPMQLISRCSQGFLHGMG